MQRREAKKRRERPQCHQRPNERNDTGENPHRNGLSGAGAEICGFAGLDGGRTRCRTWDPMIKSQLVLQARGCLTTQCLWLGLARAVQRILRLQRARNDALPRRSFPFLKRVQGFTSRVISRIRLERRRMLVATDLLRSDRLTPGFDRQQL